MNVRRGLLNWGVFLLCLGAVPLAVQVGLLDAATAGDLLRLWPLILIGIGLGLLLRFTPFGALGGIVVAGTFGLLFGTLLAGGLPSTATACGSGQVAGPEVVREGDFTGTQASLTMDLNCAQFDVARAPGQHWAVEAVTGDADPRIESSASSLSLRSDQRGGFLFTGEGRETWHVSLPVDPALSLSMTVNAARGSASVGMGRLEHVNATFNASDVRLDMSGPDDGDAPTLNGTLNASSVTAVLPDGPFSGNMTVNASSLTLCVAPTVGLSIGYEETLSSHNFAAAGLTGEGRTWQTPGYAEAASQARLDLNANVSSITIDRSGGCQ